MHYRLLLPLYFGEGVRIIISQKYKWGNNPTFLPKDSDTVNAKEMMVSSLKCKYTNIIHTHTCIYVDSEFGFIWSLHDNFVNVFVDIAHWLVSGWDLNGSNPTFPDNLLLKA